MLDMSGEQQRAQVAVAAEQAGERAGRDGKGLWEGSQFALSEVQTL